MKKALYLLLVSICWSTALVGQKAPECKIKTDELDTKAYVATYTDKNTYDQAWYTKRDLLDLILPSIGPRPTVTNYHDYTATLEYLINEEGKLEGVRIVEDEHQGILELVQEALVEAPLFFPATKRGKAVCSVGSLKIPLGKLVNPATSEFFPDLVYKKPLYGMSACRGLDPQEAVECSEKELLMKIYRGIRYPAMARENGVQGTVVIGFDVDEMGQASAYEIIKEIGGGCGAESLRVVQKYLQKWQPAYDENGQAVKFRYEMPVRFKLVSGDRKRERAFVPVG